MALSSTCFDGFQPKLVHRCNMGTLICWWGQRSCIKVKGHLRSSCKMWMWKWPHLKSPIWTKLGLFRLTDIYLQTWRAGVSMVSESDKLRTYRSFKFNLATEKYLTVITNYKFRKSLTKFAVETIIWEFKVIEKIILIMKIVSVSCVQIAKLKMNFTFIGMPFLWKPSK